MLFELGRAFLITYQNMTSATENVASMRNISSGLEFGKTSPNHMTTARMAEMISIERQDHRSHTDQTKE